MNGQLKKTRNSFILVILLAATATVCWSFSFPVTMWEKRSSHINEDEINCLAVHPENNDVVFAGTTNAVYRSTERGQGYKPILNLSGSQTSVNDIYIGEEAPYPMFVATDQGVYMRDYSDENFRVAYTVKGAQSQRCLAVMADGRYVYVGTSTGLYVKSKDDTVWQRWPGELGSKPVYVLARDHAYIYAATDASLYRVDAAKRLAQNIFSLRAYTAETAVEDDDALSEQRRIRDVQTAGPDSSRIVLASDDGIFLSRDHGVSWDRLPIQGLPAQAVQSILIFPLGTASHGTQALCGEPWRLSAESLAILAGTGQGIFLFDGKRWLPLYGGMEAGQVRRLTRSLDGDIYAATNRGIFFMPGEKALAVLSERLAEKNFYQTADYQTLSKHFADEPTIQQVHRWAIQYADVMPEKIETWRHDALRRAWLPDLTVGVDGDNNRTLSDSVWGSYSSGGQVYIGPDDKTLYDNLGWSVSLSWDLGDIVWSTDQTTIDSRSKMMVELREDILDEVTRFYFERRRAQIDLLLASQNGLPLDMNQEMRIDELTALIDALTDGNFSRMITKPSEEN